MEALREAVAAVVARTPITDIHTHLFAPPFGGLLLYGVDELITYHYCIAEALRASDVPYDTFWNMDKRGQADLIWKELFIDRSPVSESCRGVLTALDKLGLDVASRDLAAYRAYFADADLAAHIDNVFACAGLTSVVMTNDPFDETERPVWERGFEGDERFRAALRIDPLLLDWKNTAPRLQGWGYDADAMLSPNARAEVRRFLSDWIKKTKSLYMAVSLPPTFAYPSDTEYSTLLDECVVPVAQEHNVPFAMMIGVKRNVNPGIRLAGDGVGQGDVGAVERLCAAYPDAKFMVTMLSRENQHELCVAGRKFRNLFLFGCWWFLNDPSLIEEITRMRLELLGLSVLPQHSDARVLEQVVYKWSHSRTIIAKVLADKYADLAGTGWTIDEAEIERDVARLFGGNFWNFIA
ncbi:MAG: glucuronate isomerase [Candidatus Hydrogenedentes bacterium]|nr:glucuronate isomerase [Candidatus Hydrogenedentota bacterium]